MQKANLESVLLESGTGQIKGFFRLPDRVGLISYCSYATERWYLENPTEQDSIEELTAQLEEEKSKIGQRIGEYEKMYENPIINLSTQSGVFMGSYLIKQINDTGGSEQGEFQIVLTSKKNPDLVICVDTQQDCLDADYGECLMYIDVINMNSLSVPFKFEL